MCVSAEIRIHVFHTGRVSHGSLVLRGGRYPIDYGDITKGRKRYRHKEVKAADLLRGISAEK